MYTFYKLDCRMYTYTFYDLGHRMYAAETIECILYIVQFIEWIHPTICPFYKTGYRLYTFYDYPHSMQRIQMIEK